jgi:hypothetical protein
MARSNDLAWKTIEQIASTASTFLNPVLAGNAGIWNPRIDCPWRSAATARVTAVVVFPDPPFSLTTATILVTLGTSSAALLSRQQST